MAVKLQRILFHAPKFCAEEECSGLIRRGPARITVDGRPLHPGFCARYFASYRGQDTLSPEPVHVQYDCALPRNPRRYLLEHLPAIAPLVEIASKLAPHDARRMFRALGAVYPARPTIERPYLNPGTFSYFSDHLLAGVGLDPQDDVVESCLQYPEIASLNRALGRLDLATQASAYSAITTLMESIGFSGSDLQYLARSHRSSIL